MIEDIKFLLTRNGLCMQFKNSEKKDEIIKEMQNKGIDFFTQETGNSCYITPYSKDNIFGWFLSEHQRISLSFPSESLKFFFKERIGLSSDYLMDMGPGYDAQLHFNTDLFPPVEGASIMTAKKIKYHP